MCAWSLCLRHPVTSLCQPGCFWDKWKSRGPCVRKSRPPGHRAGLLMRPDPASPSSVWNERCVHGDTANPLLRLHTADSLPHGSRGQALPPVEEPDLSVVLGPEMPPPSPGALLGDAVSFACAGSSHTQGNVHGGNFSRSQLQTPESVKDSLSWLSKSTPTTHSLAIPFIRSQGTLASDHRLRSLRKVVREPWRPPGAGGEAAGRLGGTFYQRGNPDFGTCMCCSNRSAVPAAAPGQPPVRHLALAALCTVSRPEGS